MECAPPFHCTLGSVLEFTQPCLWVPNLMLLHRKILHHQRFELAARRIGLLREHAFHIPPQASLHICLPRNIRNTSRRHWCLSFHSSFSEVVSVNAWRQLRSSKLRSVILCTSHSHCDMPKKLFPHACEETAHPQIEQSPRQPSCEP